MFLSGGGNRDYYYYAMSLFLVHHILNDPRITVLDTLTSRALMFGRSSITYGQIDTCILYIYIYI